MADPGETRDRGDVDDAAAALGEHLRAEVPAQQKRAKQIHVHDALPLVRRGVLRRNDQADARVVDQRIGGAEVAPDARGHFFDEGFRGHIAAQSVHLGPGSAQPPLLLIERLQVQHDHAIAASRQKRSHGEPDPLGGAGDDCGVHPAATRPPETAGAAAGCSSTRIPSHASALMTANPTPTKNAVVHAC